MERERCMKDRNYCYKIMYALGMIFVATGHCGGGGISLLYDWFPHAAFKLGLFAFVSGYFYKNNAEKGVWKYILKKVKSLLIPLYLWNVFYALVVIFLYRFGFTMGEK